MIHIRSFNNQSINIKENIARGYSLVEMLVVITTSAGVLMVTYMMLTMVMRRTAIGNDQQARGESLARVVARLRTAAHESAGGRVAEEGKSIELNDMNSAETSSLQFKIKDLPFRLEVIEGKSGRRQILDLTGFTNGRFRVEKPVGFDKSLVSLELWPKVNGRPGRDQDRSVPLIIQAAVGLDLIEKGTGGGGEK